MFLVGGYKQKHIHLTIASFFTIMIFFSIEINKNHLNEKPASDICRNLVKNCSSWFMTDYFWFLRDQTIRVWCQKLCHWSKTIGTQVEQPINCCSLGTGKGNKSHKHRYEPQTNPLPEKPQTLTTVPSEQPMRKCLLNSQGLMLCL